MTTSDPTSDSSPRQGPGRTPKFSRNQIVDAAMSCAQEADLDTITMRSVATALGSSPMTLYRYVQDRDELLAITADGVLATISLPSPPTLINLSDWLFEATNLVRITLLKYPGTAEHLLLSGPTGPHGFTLMATVCRGLALTGRDPRQLADAYNWLLTTMTAYVCKESQLAQTGGAALAAETFHSRFGAALTETQVEDLAWLSPVIASFTGDMEAAFARDIKAVIHTIIGDTTVSNTITCNT